MWGGLFEGLQVKTLRNDPENLEQAVTKDRSTTSPSAEKLPRFNVAEVSLLFGFIGTLTQFHALEVLFVVQLYLLGRNDFGGGERERERERFVFIGSIIPSLCFPVLFVFQSVWLLKSPSILGSWGSGLFLCCHNDCLHGNDDPMRELL